MNGGASAADDEDSDTILYAVQDAIATITLNRPRYNNAQNGRMLYALDDAFKRAASDDAVKVIVLRGAGKHFTAGHDIGSPGRDVEQSQERVTLWYDHSDKVGGEFLYAREADAYLGLCRRWRELPKPTIAMVHGACISGGLMLAWVCDLIIASDDAFFADPVVHMGIPGVEYFAHAYELHPRIAKEFLMLGERMSAERAYQMGMVNRVFARTDLERETYRIAAKLAKMPRLGLALTKQAVNHVEDLQGKRAAMDAAFAWHHFAHAQNIIETGDRLGGYDAKSMSTINKSDQG
jgi:enoyl-CoA hydratase